MDIKQLRIGNLLQTPDKITPVFHIDLIGDEHDRINYCGAGLYSPIEITEEWLLKAGFNTKTYSEERGMFNYWGKELDGSLWQNPEDNTFYYKLSQHWSIPVYYLHSLQNLYFAIKGQELTFN